VPVTGGAVYGPIRPVLMLQIGKFDLNTDRQSHIKTIYEPRVKIVAHPCPVRKMGPTKEKNNLK